MFNDAVEYYEMIAKSPVVPRFHRPHVAKVKRRFLHPPEAWRLLEFARNSYLGRPVWLGLLSALRISEIQALLGSRLQFDLGQMLVCAAYNNKTGLMQPYPKQEDWAYVPMPPKLRDYLLENPPGPNDYVAPGPNGGMLSYDTFIKALKSLCRKADVPVITPHELRHSCTEIWVQAGASTEDIRRLLNHHSLDSTQNYIHRTSPRLHALGARLDDRPVLTLVEGNNSSSFPNSFPAGKKEADCQGSEAIENVH
jgi:integrase